MGFFDSIRNFKQELDKVESTVYSGKQSLLELYELNARLEAEIAQRTKELDTANQQMLTLHHILDMMNSSKPLSSVLNAITSSLQGELGYLHSCIVKKMVDNQGEYLQMVAHSGELFGSMFIEHFNCDADDMRFKMPNINTMHENIESNEIFQSKNIAELITESTPGAVFDAIESKIQKTNIKSYIFIPLTCNHTHFGSLIVFSSREDAT